MATFRLATFNCENLFARYQFKENFTGNPSQGWSINETTFDILDEPQKKVTGQAIREADADILCLQEVENLPTLERFASRYCAPQKYKHRLLIDSHDPRNIDVGVLSRFPILTIRTHRDLRTPNNKAFLYSRDCLEVTLGVDGKEFTVYVNHLKSMMGGRDETHARRKEQADHVAGIVKSRWGAKLEGNFAVVGDLNDYIDADTALDVLVKKPLVNIVDRLPKVDQWTHYWAGGGEYRQLDYILLPGPLDKAQGNPVPGVVRKGLPWRATNYTGPRFDDVGENEPKASDHCPLFVDLDTANLL